MDKNNGACSNCVDELLLRHRRVIFTRIGEHKVTMQLVADVDPDSTETIVDSNAANCLSRVNTDNHK